MKKPETDPATCPVCQGRGEVSRFYRAYMEHLLSPRPGWEEVGLVLVAGLLFLACAWLGVRAWDREAMIQEEQVQKFYRERDR